MAGDGSRKWKGCDVMLARLLSALLGVAAVLNAAIMLIAPRIYFTSVPGVVDTGPFNAHLVRDLGAAGLAAGLVLAWHAISRLPPLSGLWVAAGMFCFHALIHPSEFVAGGRTVRAALVQDLPLVYFPALVTVCLAVVAARKAAETRPQRSDGHGCVMSGGDDDWFRLR